MIYQVYTKIFHTTCFDPRKTNKSIFFLMIKILGASLTKLVLLQIVP